MRGHEEDQYHLYLAAYYQSERQSKQSIRRLGDTLANKPKGAELTQQLKNAHLQMGRKLREAIRVFNDTAINPGKVSDRFATDAEVPSAKLLNQIIEEVQLWHDNQIKVLVENRTTQERFLITLLLLTSLASLGLLLWLLDKNVAKPAERAARLAEVIKTAQHVAQFGTWHIHQGAHKWSEGVYAILKCSKQTKPSVESLVQLVVPQQQQQVQYELERSLSEGGSFEIEAELSDEKEQRRTVLLRGEVNALDDGKEQQMTGIIYDISAQKLSEEKLARLANYDPLTGLPNRNLFRDRIRQAMARAERSRVTFALLFIDLDRFKSVNDALGHSIGDSLLVEAANRLTRVIRESDTAARMGGDEFTVVIEQIETTSNVAAVAQNLLDSLSSPFVVTGNEIHISASIGITLYPNDAENIEDLLKNADTAMYRAKDEGRNNYHFFTQELNQKAHQSLLLKNNLHMALQRQEFSLHYQPQYDLASGKLYGAEALLRWNSPEGMISPVQFIPVLEETGLILSVGHWVLDEACRFAKSLQADLHPGFRIAVNLSVKQLRQPTLVAEVKEVLAKHQLDHESLEIEITESSLIDTQQSKANLQQLEELGVKISIDDFGTGYSSLSYLKNYSVDLIKIDRSFINDLQTEDDSSEIVGAIIALSHNLGMKVVAEGIETAEQSVYLAALGCDFGQGYHLGKPMPGEIFIDHLAKAESLSDESG